MNFQTLVSKVSFGTKGFDIVPNYNKGPILILKNKYDSESIIESKIKKLSSETIEVINIETNETKKITPTKFINKFSNLNFKIIFAIGGGSIIDFAKRIVLELNVINKTKIEFYVLPTRLGSGAESSHTSILNINNKKIFDVNNEFIPDGVIYYTKFYKELSYNQLIMGATDAIMHCIESSLSFNDNYFSNYLSKSTMKFILENESIDKLINNSELEDDDFKNLCILSFNGGICQNNSGSGICHALAHSTEREINLSHIDCVSFYSKFVINYLNKTNEKFKDLFDKNISNLIYNMSEKIKTNKNYIIIKDHIQNKKNLTKIIEQAKEDPCWRLYKNKIEIELLIKEINNV